MNEQDLLESVLAVDDMPLEDLRPSVIDLFKNAIDLDLSPVAEEELVEITNTPTRRVINVVNDAVMDKDAERIHRLCQVSSKFASTLALRQIRADVSDEQYGGAPAWSDSESITFQRNAIGDLTDPAEVTNIKGLTLHELAHILLTPRNGSKLNKDVTKAKVWRAYNALEDQRIEMYMTTKYGSTSDWLTATVAKHILKQPEQVPVAFTLLHGRKYLPQSLRDAVRDAYIDQQNVVEIASLIDRYIKLNIGDPNTYAEALSIIIRYDELVNSLPPANPDSWNPRAGWNRVSDPNGHQDRRENEWKSSSASKPANKAEQESVIARIQMGVEGSDGESSEGDGGVPDALSSGDQSDNGGTGVGGEHTLAEQLARTTLDRVLQRRASDIANQIKQLTGEIELSSKPLPDPKRPEWMYNQPVSADVVQASKSFGAELARLRAEHDPGWSRRTESGKLNVQRYVTGCDVDEAFDTWDMGREDAVDIECVVLLDVSGSMGSVINQAYQNMWAIKRALDKINASTTVILYSDTTELLYSAKERAAVTMKYAGTGGSTEPLKGLRYARSVFANSNRAIKICIAITDGWWDEAEACNNILQQFRKAGVLTALAFMDTQWEYRKDNKDYVPTIDSHGCEVAVHVTEPRDLFGLAKSMVKAGVARNLGN